MKKLFTTLALVGGFFTAQRAFAAPVGMATEITGQVQFKSGAATRALRPLQRLSSGDVVICSAKSSAVIVLFGNSQRFVVGPGKKGVLSTTSVQGGGKLGKLTGPSAQVAARLGKTRTGAIMFRAASAPIALTPTSTGWKNEGDRNFTWTPSLDSKGQPVPGMIYVLTLFDRQDRPVWTTRVTEATADYPADYPPLSLGQPYVWRIDECNADGVYSTRSRWGIITWLSATDLAEMREESSAMLTEILRKPDNHTLPLLLSQLYAEYGVFHEALLVLEKLTEDNVPGADDAVDATYARISGYARLLRPSK